jgi:putative effector of murein hydrolase
MNQEVKKVILSVMEDNCDINLLVPYQRELLAELCEQALTKAVVMQVADLLGGHVEICPTSSAGIIVTPVGMGAEDIA